MAQCIALGQCGGPSRARPACSRSSMSGMSSASCPTREGSCSSRIRLSAGVSYGSVQADDRRRRRVQRRMHVSTAGFEAPTMQDFEQVAEGRGVALKLETFGPTFKILCTSLTEPEAPPLGVLEARFRSGTQLRCPASPVGFIAPPFKLLHLDSIRIYNSRIRGTSRSRAQTPFGLSLLLGGAAFLYARDQGCTKAELLAIDDDNGYAERLVAYYRRLGFVPVRKVVGTGITDIPHMIVWGGVGTRMDADIPELLEKWARAVLSRKAPDAE